MFLMDRTLISKIYLTSLVKHMKIVGTLQNFKICTKFFPPPQHNSIRVLNAIPKTNLGNKDWLLKTYHDGAHFLKQKWCPFPSQIPFFGSREGVFSRFYLIIFFIIYYRKIRLRTKKIDALKLNEHVRLTTGLTLLNC